MDTTLAINIPIAVYAYDRHKLATDPKAVKRIGFYDKRKVLTETKFQKYYVKATAIASRAAFKDYQKLLVDMDEQNDVPKAKRNTMFAKDNTGIVIHEQKYTINREKQLLNKNTAYNVYVPIKYYKINQQQIRGTIQGLLAFQRVPQKWVLYNGSIGKNISVEYAYNEFELWKFWYEKEFGVSVEMSIGEDGVVDENEARQKIKDATQKFVNMQKNKNILRFKDIGLDCAGEFSNSVIDVVSVSFGHVMTVGLFYMFWGYKRFLNFGTIFIDCVRGLFGIYEPSGAVNDNYLSLPFQVLNDLKPLFNTFFNNTVVGTDINMTDDGDILTLLIGDDLIDKETTANSIIDQLQSIATWVGDIISEMLSKFSVLYAKAGTNINNYIPKIFWTIVTLVDQYKVFDITAVLYQIYGTATGKNTSARRMWMEIACTLAQTFRWAFTGTFSKTDSNVLLVSKLSGITSFINKFRKKQYKSLLLKENNEWIKAKKDLVDYGVAEQIDIDFEDEAALDYRPRLILENVKKKVIYSTTANRRFNILPMLSAAGGKFPYVYVVAIGTKADTENNKVIKYWYFYDYHYKPNENVFELYEIQQEENKKQTLSVKIPKRPAGEFCQWKINNVTVGGVPFWAYSIGVTISPYIFGWFLGALNLIYNEGVGLGLNVATLILDPKSIQTNMQAFLMMKNAGPVLNLMQTFTNNMIMLTNWFGISTFWKLMDKTNNFLLKEDFLADVIAYVIALPVASAVASSIPETYSKVIKYMEKVSGKKISSVETITSLSRLYYYVYRLIEFIPCAVAIFIYNTYIELTGKIEDKQ